MWLFGYCGRISVFSFTLLVIAHLPVYEATTIDGIRDNVLKEFVAARQVYVYRAYKDMQIFHFTIPPHVANAVFNLTSNNTDGCYPRNITVYLQAESYPVVSPDGAEFPQLTWASRQPVYQATLLSDLKPVFLTVVAPQPGDWFMVGFIFDDSNRITQAGLFPSCYAWLQIDASYYQENDIEILNTHVIVNETSFLYYEIDDSVYFSFFVPSNVWSVNVTIKNCRSILEGNATEPFFNETRICPLDIMLRPLALPYENAPNLISENCSAFSEFGSCNFSFTPLEDAWHYLYLTPDVASFSTSFEIGVSLQFCSNENTRGDPIYLLLEEELFFKEVQLEERLKNALRKLNVTFNVTSTDNDLDSDMQLNFKDYDAQVISAMEEDPVINHLITQTTQTIGFKNPTLFIKHHSMKRSIDVPTNETTKNPENILTRRNFNPKSSICWPRHQLTRKTFPGNFVYEFDLRPDKNGSVPLMLNLSNQVPTILTFDLQAIIDIGGTLNVDLAISPFMNTTSHNYTVAGCLNVDIRGTYGEQDGELQCNRGYLLKVNTSQSSYFSGSVMVPYPEPGRWFFTLYPSCFLTNQSEPVPCTNNVTTVIFSISSASCILGKCGKYGSCFQYISGGFIFSTCVCDVGYRGYACNDGSEAIPDWKLLLSTLLLCLSNLFFLPAIFLALYRGFYAEALVYAFTMFFSTFYHACDQDIYNFCMMRLSVLQFCDFYSAILSFWVTLIVMANLPPSVYSLLHMAGAVVVALGVEYDRTGLWVFAIPSISAFIIMALAWIWHSKKEKKCYPPRRYWIRCLLPGTILAAVGLICYAFLETEDNYYIIHSFWHAIMALSILCLLPHRANTKEHLFTMGNSIEDGEIQTSDAQALTVNLNL